jgi:hypothetical protein
MQHCTLDVFYREKRSRSVAAEREKETLWETKQKSEELQIVLQSR